MKKNLKDKKSLNIAMLGHKRIPSREGGIEIVVEELATRMVTLGHGSHHLFRDIHIISSEICGDPVKGHPIYIFRVHDTRNEGRGSDTVP